MSEVDAQLEGFHEQGYVVLEGVLSPSELDALRGDLQPYLDLQLRGRNDFEGERTQRVYSLVGRGKSFERTVEHPAVLALLDRLLLPGYLLSASQAICIGPGETPQPVHYDDGFYKLPRPRPAVSISTIWALDDFSGPGGATEVIPGSHRWGDEQVAGTYTDGSGTSQDPSLPGALVPVEMPAGSLVVFSGTLLHRGGANHSASIRRAFSHQYCEPWARQQESYLLSVPRERARSMSPRLRELLGYSIHPPFMGQVAGRHPEKTLDEGYQNSLVSDDAEIAAQHGEEPPA